MSICLQYAETGTCRYGDGCRFEHTAGATINQKKNKKGSRFRPNHAFAPNHIDNFFSGYPSFDYDPSKSFVEEFKRMCNHLRFHSKKNKNKKDRALDGLRHAMVLQFNDTYGTNAEDLESWQKLCEVIGIKNIPNKLKACRGVVVSSHVNICDLLDAPLIGTTPIRFRSQVDLSTYTIATGRYFPKDDINAGSLLRYLRRQIITPPGRKATGN